MATVNWEVVEGEMKPVMYEGDRPIGQAIWSPLPGSQAAVLECPIFELLYHGTRGGGKTDTLIMDFAQHVGQGYGAEWKGILFRQSFPQLADVISKTKKWFPQIFPSATFNEAKSTWKWPSGETLRLAFMSKEDDYHNYHGHNFTWIAWEELTTWPDDKCYKVMMSCCRSAVKGIPLKYRSTTNPYGPGHSWVKDRFELHSKQNTLAGKIIEDSETNTKRVSIRSTLEENIVLMHADPRYMDRIKAAARNPSELAAWLEGSWDIVSGGMFDPEVWDAQYNVLAPFDIPLSWKLDRSFDWGSSKPFSVGWWAESDGSDVTLANGDVIRTVPGDLFRVAEWYGFTGEPNKGVRMNAMEIAEGILEREAIWFEGRKVKAGPADASIYTKQNDNSIAEDMESMRVRWVPSNKAPGSRKMGWDKMRAMMKEARNPSS